MWVHAEAIPLLSRVYDRYGDMFSESTLRSCSFLTVAAESLVKCLALLERCSVRVLRAEDKALIKATLDDLESINVNVGWLRNHYDGVITMMGDFATIERLEKQLEEVKARIGRSSTFPGAVAALDDAIITGLL
ncbi:hypothetical protein L1049_013023 [Liquidambar formosana]|uniref:Uncharacterized protein n=1 Tax=Liquidambar formosana TaxID=63359 RepID=A0AAP0RJR0_LIQFO